ncbi:MAG: hybrid sensor histidine kinase/response regulator [Micavibrio sp.]|nr:hybrid sensor histidine kinase/response regulator [Micavibrio sp.]
MTYKPDLLDKIPLPCLIITKDKSESCLYANDLFLEIAVSNAIKDQKLGQLISGLTIGQCKTKSQIEINGQIYKPTLQDIDYTGKKATLIFLSNVTELAQSTSKFKEAANEAEAMIELKSNFLATMSHEIRTPMQSVFGLLELIAEEKPQQSIMDMVTTARESASGLLEILDDILDLAKLDADKMEIDDFEVPVRLMARGTLEALSVKKHGPNVAMIDEISEDVPFVIKGDPKRLRQILMNFMSNALKFTKKGHVKLRIHTNVEHVDAPKDGVALRFEVEDTGMGMSEEVRSKLFQPFVQADSSTARKFGGTGLGLSICKKLVEVMNGVIGVDSTPGKGSTFWFEIPTYIVGTDQTSVELPNLDGIAVLSVEDHPQGGKEIVNSLRSMGAEVTLVTTYKEGLAMAKRRPFDVAVIDQGLPDGLGIDLLKELSEIRPFMGQVMYTVRDDYGLQHACKAMGATYLVKPASRAGLGEAVEAASSHASKHIVDGPQRLLIAEDTLSVQDVLRRQLELLGVEADFVEDGAEALKAMATGKYGILMTDLHMPAVDGYEVVKTIRDKEKGTDLHTPIIVLTADVQMAQRQAYLVEGFDECLLKPVSLGQFRRLLMRWGILSEEKNIEALEEENPTSTNKPIIDTVAMKNQLGAFDLDSLNMIRMFVEMTKPVIEKLITANEAKDTHQVGEIAHSLKGSARSACCMILGDLASDAQDAAEHNRAYDKFIPQIEKAFADIPAEIERLKKTL